MIHNHGLVENVADQPGQKTWLVMRLTNMIKEPGQR
jgi:hypothetical protein